MSAIGEPPRRPDETATLQLHAEDIVVTKRVVETGVVQVATATQIREQVVEALLDIDTVQIERVHVGRLVPTTPDIRQEGDITIVPVMEEVLVVEKRLMLKEEIHIRRLRGQRMHHETVQLREQVASVTRQAADGPMPSHVSTSTEDEIT